MNMDTEHADLQDLKRELSGAATPSDFIDIAWRTSAKNHAARCYLAGAIDALRYAKAIDLATYNLMCDACMSSKLS
jgi:hypothetical protein